MRVGGEKRKFSDSIIWGQRKAILDNEDAPLGSSFFLTPPPRDEMISKPGDQNAIAGRNQVSSEVMRFKKQHEGRMRRICFAQVHEMNFTN